MIFRKAYSVIAGHGIREGWLYVDSVFPIQLGRWDFRHYIGIFRQEHLLGVLQSRLENLSNIYNFRPLELQPLRKDGGVFVRFSYSSPDPDTDIPWSTLQEALVQEISKQGVLPTWLGMGSGSLWVVRGRPWKEDMDRFASHILNVAFDGPDLQEQTIYELCRPYGRIADIYPPASAPPGSLRSCTIAFHRVHAATIARSVIHGLELPAPSPSPSVSPRTRLSTHYEQPMKSHIIRNWMSNHPKVMLPVIVFLLGTLTYTIFDPLRSLMVEARIFNWFNYKEFKIYEWLHKDNFGASVVPDGLPFIHSDVWKERKEAEKALKAYLLDLPTAVTFVHGPQGSGKTSMVEAVVKESGRSTLIIDCRLLHNATSDSKLVAALASQTGYWPVFNFLDSMNNLVDLASISLIGQKAGMSSSLPERLKKILDVVTTALQGVASSHQSAFQRQIQRENRLASRQVMDESKRRAIIEGNWHDGRLDCVAGNGVMSELGVGDEPYERDLKIGGSPEQKNLPPDLAMKRRNSFEDVQAIKGLPIVIIRNYATISTSVMGREELLSVLAQWVSTLAENQIAHIIVLSDNRENSKRLTKALPTKPLNLIALSDADQSSSLSFVKQKLNDAGIEIGISPQETKDIERLGGRASDLESLIHKVRGGMKVDEAVEDIINKGVAELRKNAFGDDAEDGNRLPWTRYQAWKLLKALANAPEVGYYEILTEFPFKGDENALRSLEHADLISIITKDGRPSVVRPGKPVFRWVFQRVVNDKVFQATQDLAYNEKEISETETKIHQYEQELIALEETLRKQRERRWWVSFGSSGCAERARYVGEKLVIAGRKVERLDRQNRELKIMLRNK